MDAVKKKLKGSKFRDDWKRAHKDNSRTHYGTDIDFAFIEFDPPGIVAFCDVKQMGNDIIQQTEKVAYNELTRTVAPVYIVEATNPREGPFHVFRYRYGNIKNASERPNLEYVDVFQDWIELHEWEEQLREEYRRSANRTTTYPR